MPAVIERIAAEGVTFSNAYVATPICGPSRGSLLTGQYPFHHGAFRNAFPLGGALFDDTNTVATWLAQAGYQTAFYGKYLNGYELRWTHVDRP